jgi:Protein of unknown function (DUF1572)
MRDHLASLEQEFRRYKALAEGAIAQVDEVELGRVTPGFDNSIAILVWHMSGNLKSRFTDFLTTDGEKPWRGRDEEFVARSVNREALLAKWEEGWSVLLTTLSTLGDDDLKRTITIRQVPAQVDQAIYRALAHTAYHAGQIVYIAKAACGARWTFMSIPPGKSDEYNRAPTRETSPGSLR